MSDNGRSTVRRLPLSHARTGVDRTRTCYVQTSSIEYVVHARWVPAWVEEFRSVSWPSLRCVPNERLVNSLRICASKEIWYVNARRGEHQTLEFLLDLHRLAQSIDENGLLNPVILNPVPGTERYQLIAGQRRLLASVYAGHHEIRASVFQRPVSYKKFLSIQSDDNWEWDHENTILDEK